MAMAEAEGRFPGAGDEPLYLEEGRRLAEQRCLEAEQRCFSAERRRFEAERQREQVEELLHRAQQAGERMAQIVVELKRLVVELRRAHEQPVTQASAEEHDGDQVAHALAAAVERLRARVEAVGEQPAPAATGVPTSADRPPAPTPLQQPPVPTPEPPAGSVELPTVVHMPPMSPQQRPAGPAELPTVVHMPPAPPAPVRPPHKHSMSWIGRWRARRKQRY